MTDLNSVIVEGVVTVSPITNGLFCIETTFYKGGEKHSIAIACQLGGTLSLEKSAELTCRKRVRVVGYIDRLAMDSVCWETRWRTSTIGIYVEHVDVLSTVIKSGKYNFTKEN